jgi:predicted ABC-type ATPase
MSRAAPQAVVIAGPNGSGKSTAAELLLPPGMTFINADMIAQEISGQRSTTADLQAGRILVGRLEDLQRNRKDFAVETTLATKKLEPRLKHLSESGYDTHLIFLWMPSDDLSVERVKARVRAGGHDIPEETIRRRFKSGLELFFTLYKDIVDSWRLYDNSRIADPRLIATGKRGTAPEVKQPDLFDQICKKWMP